MTNKATDKPLTLQEQTEKLKKLARSFFGQGAVGWAPNPDHDFEHAWRDYLKTGELCKWRYHRSTWDEKLPVKELLFEALKEEIERLQSSLIEVAEKSYAHSESQRKEIEALKQALKKVNNIPPYL